MYLDSAPTGDRLRAAIPVIAVHALLALVLLRGLQGGPVADESEPLQLTPVPPPVTIIEPDRPPPPPPADKAAPDPLRLADPRPEGAASPPNLKAEPSPFVAPEPIVRPPPPPPTVTPSPIAGIGSAPSAGAAPIRGPGMGSGGVGNGRGSGAGGSGPGGGGGGGGGDGAGIVVRPPRWVCCDISPDEMPQAVQDRAPRGRSVVSVVYAVEADGRVTGCRVSRSSGNRELDQMTCRLVERRYRFQPARNPYGRAIRVEDVGDDHEWFFEDEMDEPSRRRGR